MWAEDIVHDVFLSMYQHPEKHTSIQYKEAWLRKCAANAALNALKKTQNISFEAATNPEMRETEEPIDFDGISLDQILGALNELPEGYRIVTELVLLDQWSHNEVAEALEISPSNSRSQLARAKKRLQEKLITYVK